MDTDRSLSVTFMSQSQLNFETRLRKIQELARSSEIRFFPPGPNLQRTEQEEYQLENQQLTKCGIFAASTFLKTT